MIESQYFGLQVSCPMSQHRQRQSQWDHLWILPLSVRAPLKWGMVQWLDINPHTLSSSNAQHQFFLDKHFIFSRYKIRCHIRVADGIKQMICSAGGENPESSHQPVVWVTVWSPPVQSALSNSTNLVLLFWREHLVLSLCPVLHRFINFTQRILTLT